MNKPIIVILLICILLIKNSFLVAQLSPGKLTQAHSKLEGLSNCTQCHTIGAKISEQKCLSCHKELNARIKINRGYHVSSEVKGKECISCHSEHHGLKFEMVRFDKKTFDHKLTGYELTGAHKITDCKACHSPSNITVSSLKQKPETFLGLDTRCISCHDDYHQKTLSDNCASCHNTTDFKPATLFNHAKTDFPLAGAHKSVDCASCHKTEIRNGTKFQQFAGIPHKQCSSCHVDVHKGNFGQQCKSCHSEESFHKISAGPGFNHSVTGFKLEGKHQKLDCRSCHDKSFGLSGHFKEFKGKDNRDCRVCHEDVHEGKFGSLCLDCHDQQSFKIASTRELKQFDHNSTGFVLLGKHQQVDCRKCHQENYTTPLVHDQCISCHKDYHNGDFATKKDKYPDCSSCHSEQGFSPSGFTIEQHEMSAFPLEGGHLATPCNACHMKENKWKFNLPDKQCQSCHDDIHRGYISEKYYPGKSCNSCHTTETWSNIGFDHALTGWKLEGKHGLVQCASCHIDKTGKEIIQKFTGLGRECVNCHENVHGEQFVVDGKTDCLRCHGFGNWEPDRFDHSLTRFKLEGAHQGLACSKCHKELVINGKNTLNYRIEKFACVDCHQ